MKKPVIIDCDPGHDDAIALLLAISSEELEVKAVTTVGGNQTSEKTLNNAMRILSFAGVEGIPVAPGASQPLVRELQIAPEVHGESGLEGPYLPEPTFKPYGKGAIELMEEIIMTSKDKIVLVPTGPLTNIATLLLTVPNVKDRIERISLMGGSAVGGNWTPAAEFNILVDPEAADVVFKSGIPITMSGLDVTHKAQVYDEEIESIRLQGGKVSVMVAELLDFFAKFHKEMGFEGSPLHDPCAVAWLIKPDIFTTKHLHVAIETKGEFTTGATVVDYRGVTGKIPNTEVIYDVDREAFIKLLMDSLKKYH
ncbi:pyrimidine-specific ribonucleoside hydrolase RihA [Tindallia californiensis]|uniref:Pyrimidine-specific ribonucleoside hydrolase n=1 Tax=Tindallia californiensis TaxID=159292 RepID=A0A1H3I8V2_9FIRM|nr:pyrimidine-specific ribonucleoside hydrolase RihA [Tindallia californiensis]SDY23659.1 pyrimidine-specific ribonucleoside hydrolase [Tindallia californiensis]